MCFPFQKEDRDIYHIDVDPKEFNLICRKIKCFFKTLNVIYSEGSILVFNNSAVNKEFETSICVCEVTYCERIAEYMVYSIRQMYTTEKYKKSLDKAL